ncbi:Hypothetical protein EHI5A_105380 [Entamoeba histolytica KU27]|uniref:Gtpaseactivator protein for Ras family gtpase n=1 Tax=Entamoeba histolytica KU27 TaxID=885311 RepID=M2S9N7_ENTHI|nr:Hypothetical protein EHI5A_105380 [Entamoeba histolytica KU27]
MSSLRRNTSYLGLSPRISRLSRSNSCSSKLTPRTRFANDNNAWTSLLIPLMNDIPEATFKTMIHISMGVETNMSNSQLLFSYFVENERLAELIEYIVKREVISNIEEVLLIFDSNSCFDIMMQMFAMKEMDTFFENVVLSITQKVHKSKYKFSNDDKSITKNIKKLIKLLRIIIKEITDLSKYTPAFKYFIHELVKITFYDYPLQHCRAFEVFMIGIILEKIRLVPSKSTTEKQTMEVISLFIDNYIHPKQTEWSQLIEKEFKDINQEMDYLKQRILNLQTEKEDCVIQWKVPTVGLTVKLSKSIDEIRNYISPESQQLIDIYFNSSQPMTKRFKQIVNEINQLSINNFNEKSGVLYKMSVIKQRIKDVNEEIRYLNECLNTLNEKDQLKNESNGADEVISGNDGNNSVMSNLTNGIESQSISQSTSFILY